MSRRRKLDDEQMMELFDMVRKGYSNKDIAKKFGIVESTVRQYYQRALSDRAKKTQENGGGPRLVVVRGKSDKLTFGIEEGYVGTTLIDGMEETCSFMAKDDADAIAQFDKWLEEMQSEFEFLSRIERRNEKEPDDDAKYISSWDVRSAANVLRDYEQGKLLRDVDRDTDVLIACKERDDHIAELEAKVSTGACVGTAYVLLAVKPTIKGYGMYADMDLAFAELERLNEVSQMLGLEDAFEIHEMEWRA